MSTVEHVWSGHRTTMSVIIITVRAAAALSATTTTTSAATATTIVTATTTGVVQSAFAQVLVELVVLIYPAPCNDGNAPLFHVELDALAVSPSRRLLGEDAVLPHQVDVAPERVRGAIRQRKRQHNIGNGEATTAIRDVLIEGNQIARTDTDKALQISPALTNTTCIVRDNACC